VTALPLGKGAYERLYAGAPVVELLNRWLEANPANLREGTSVLARPGTTQIVPVLDPGTFSGLGPMRGNYALSGLFNNSLFTVCGSTLYIIADNGSGTLTVTPIIGTINGTGYPEVAWQAGIGYQRLWISDGTLLQYYAGTSSSNGTLTQNATITNGVDTVEVGGVYYTWGTVFNSGTDNGSSAHPFIVNQTSLSLGLAPLDQLVLALSGTGSPGTDYSTTLAGPNTLANGTNNSGVSPATSLKISALLPGTSGNTITFSVTGGTALAATGTGHLTGGGVQALQGCTMPGGVTPGSITQVSSYVLVSQSNRGDYNRSLELRFKRKFS
jgi:hypothetical protein